MRLLKKLVIKFAMMVLMVGLMGALFRYAKPYIMKSAGVPEGMPGTGGLESAHFSSEESDLMGTIFKSALRLFTGQAKREELAGELSGKLYGGQEGAGTRAELGIQMERPDGKPVDRAGITKSQSDSRAPAGDGSSNANSPDGATSPPKQTHDSPAQNVANKLRDALLGRVLEKMKANPELSLVPVVLLGMFVFHLFRRRRSPEDDFILPDLSNLIPSESEEYDLKNPMHSLAAEDFELLVAVLYQRQGYRVEMPAALGSGRGGDFMLLRKSEKLLVQCKKLKQDHKVHVDRVRELHEAAIAAGATRSMYVASCGYSWDARNFAKTKGIMVINARTLDGLITESFQKTGETFLEVAQWAPKLMTKVKLTPPICPACEAAMDQVTVSSGSVWVCSQRPECRGRRSARKDYKGAASGSARPEPKPQTASAPPEKSEEPLVMGGRARTICPSS